MPNKIFGLIQQNLFFLFSFFWRKRTKLGYLRLFFLFMKFGEYSNIIIYNFKNHSVNKSNKLGFEKKKISNNSRVSDLISKYFPFSFRLDLESSSRQRKKNSKDNDFLIFNFIIKNIKKLDINGKINLLSLNLFYLFSLKFYFLNIVQFPNGVIG